jgi:hypothetical protein
MTDKRYSKVEQEVINILNQMDDLPEKDPPSNLIQFRPKPKPRRFSMPARAPRRSGLLDKVSQYSAGSWLGVGIFALLLTWGFGRYGMVFTAIGLTIAAAAFLAALYVRRTGARPRGLGPASGTKRWRGQDIEFTTPKASHSKHWDIWRIGRRR